MKRVEVSDGLLAQKSSGRDRSIQASMACICFIPSAFPPRHKSHSSNQHRKQRYTHGQSTAKAQAKHGLSPIFIGLRFCVHLCYSDDC